MPKFSVQLVTALAFAGLALGELPSASAQDAPASEPITEGDPLPIPGGSSASTPLSESSSEVSYGSPMMAYGAGHNQVTMPQGGTPIRHKEWYGYQNQGPWMRPVKRPLYRVPVQYARYWPTAYYTGGSYPGTSQYAQAMPMVYQPTDTTQLGFTYQQVPQWQPRPNAIPGAPWPPNWHYRVPVRYGVYQYPYQQTMGAYGETAYGYGTGYPVESGNVTYGTPVESGTVYSQPTTTTPPAVLPSQEAPQPVIPQEATPVVPAPLPAAPAAN